jgi:hypothetical protein
MWGILGKLAPESFSNVQAKLRVATVMDVSRGKWSFYSVERLSDGFDGSYKSWEVIVVA